MLPEGWESKQLRDVALIKRGAGSQYIEYVDSAEDGVRLIRISDFLGDSICYTKLTKDIRRFLLSDNDLLIAGTGATAGITFEVPKDFIGMAHSYNAPRISVTHKANKKYILYFLKSEAIREQQLSLFTGNAQPFLDTKAIGGFKLLLPPLPEQQKIAEILSTWDRAIAVQERLIANARAQKKALMEELISFKRRLPGFSGKWNIVPLNECATCLDSRRVPINDEQRQTIQGTIPYYGANGVVDHINDYIFDEPLVLLAEDGGYFDEYKTRPIAQLIYGKSWVNNHAHILTNKSNTTIEWIFFSLVHRNILDFINGGTRAKLNKSDMLKIPMNLPCISEQVAICEILRNADRQIKQLVEDRNRLIDQKTALMQQLLTGKRRVKVEEMVL